MTASRGAAERSLKALLIPGVAAVASIVAIISVVLLMSAVDARKEVDRMGTSSDSLAISLQAERALSGIQVGVGGYLLTGEARLLAPYERARQALPALFMRMRSLADTPLEQRLVDRIAASTNRYIDEFATPLVRSGAPLPAAAVIRSDTRGRPLRDRALAELRAFEDSERREVAAIDRTLDASSTRVELLAAIGLPLTVLLMAGFAIALIRRDRALSEAREQLAAAAVEAEQASELKSSFLANMSHEIRTPLNGVLGMLSLLGDSELDREQREYVTAARTSGETLMGVIGDVLDFSKIEAGRLEIDAHDFDLHEAVESTCDALADGAHAKGLEFQAFVDPDVPRGVHADRGRLVQILGNLLSNAIKFTSEGRVDLDVTRDSRRADETPWVRFAVRDSGIGIAPDALDGLFESFTQADTSTTRRFGGTGLGLAISRELATLLGGELTAHSTPGEGSTFSLTVPLAPAHGELRPPAPHVDLRGLKVLVVDDDETNRRILDAYTAAWGMRPTAAPNATLALTRLEDAAGVGEPFDVALLDLRMPGVDGVELVRRIRALPVLHATRLIMLTSTRDENARIRAAGVETILVKPIGQSRLLDAIAAVVTDRPTRQERSRPGPTAAELAAGLRPARIVVAEDQPVNRLFVESLLERRGHMPKSAEDGEQLLAIVEAERPDLILMDCQLPGIDGYAATREIRLRESHADEPRIPIVALTAQAMEGDREACLAAGMDDYLSKPLRPEELDAVLARWLPATA
jgi:two-component system, sensor histidine kinase and response regulator